VLKPAEIYFPASQTAHTAQGQSFVSKLSSLITKNLLLSAKESRVYIFRQAMSIREKTVFFS
jgi:hypothetical protein